MYRYSAQTGGFYLPEIHGENIPADAVEITAEEHAALLQGQSAGKVICAGKGGKPELREPEHVTIAPRAVTMRQARLALLAGGYLQQVQQAMENAGDAAKIEWEYAATVERESPIVAAMAQALGLDDAALDTLFTQAAGL